MWLSLVMESRLLYGKQTSVTRLRTGSFGERRSSLVALRSCLSQPVGHRTQGDVFIFLRIERRSVEEHPWNLASFKPWTWLGLIMASGRRLSRSLSLSLQKTQNRICIMCCIKLDELLYMRGLFSCWWLSEKYTFQILLDFQHLWTCQANWSLLWCSR